MNNLFKRISLLCLLPMFFFMIGCSDDDSSSDMDDAMIEMMSTNDADMVESMEMDSSGLDITTEEGADETDDMEMDDQTMDEATNDVTDVVDDPVAQPEGRVIVAFGDSITAGVGTGEAFPAKLSRRIGSAVTARGKSGATAAGLGGRVGGVLALNPTHILVLVGTNDAIQGRNGAQVAASLNSIVDQFIASGAKTILGTIPPNYGEKAAFNPNVDSINASIRALGSSRGIAVADIHGAFGSNPALVNSDGFHPNDSGHEVIAASFAGKL